MVHLYFSFIEINIKIHSISTFNMFHGYFCSSIHDISSYCCFFSYFLGPPSVTAACCTGQSYSDPMVGAPRPFIHRISELSALEGDTVRREKRLKMKKPRKPPSWHTPSSQSPGLRIQTLESVPTIAEQNKAFEAPFSFQFLSLTACLSSLILLACLTWLIFTFWDSWPDLTPPHTFILFIYFLVITNSIQQIYVKECKSLFFILTPTSLGLFISFTLSMACRGC